MKSHFHTTSARFLIAAASLIAASAASACDLCGIPDCCVAHPKDEGVYLSAFEQFTRFGSIRVDGDEIANSAGQYLNSSITQVIAGYNFNGTIGLQFNVPLIERSYRRTGPEGIENGSVGGFGDIALMANFTPFHHEGDDSMFVIRLSGGIKAPTGDPDRLDEELEEEGHHDHADEHMHEHLPESGIHGHDLALGSGSWDGLFGATAYGELHSLFFSASMQYAVRGSGHRGYRYANDITFDAGPGVHFVKNEKWRVGLQAIISGESKGKDTFQGESADDTGITSLFLGPKIVASAGSHFDASLGFDLPVVLNNTALQAVPDWRLRAVITWRF